MLEFGVEIEITLVNSFMKKDLDLEAIDIWLESRFGLNIQIGNPEGFNPRGSMWNLTVEVDNEDSCPSKRSLYELKSPVLNMTEESIEVVEHIRKALHSFSYQTLHVHVSDDEEDIITTVENYLNYVSDLGAAAYLYNVLDTGTLYNRNHYKESTTNTFTLSPMNLGYLVMDKNTSVFDLEGFSRIFVSEFFSGEKSSGILFRKDMGTIEFRMFEKLSSYEVDCVKKVMNEFLDPRVRVTTRMIKRFRNRIANPAIDRAKLVRMHESSWFYKHINELIDLQDGEEIKFDESMIIVVSNNSTAYCRFAGDTKLYPIIFSIEEKSFTVKVTSQDEFVTSSGVMFRRSENEIEVIDGWRFGYFITFDDITVTIYLVTRAFGEALE